MLFSAEAQIDILTMLHGISNTLPCCALPFNQVNIVYNFHLAIDWKANTLLSPKYLANAIFGEGVGEGVDLLLLEGLLLSGVANFLISGGDKFLTLI